jgi:hypothetical protein
MHKEKTHKKYIPHLVVMAVGARQLHYYQHRRRLRQ